MNRYSVSKGHLRRVRTPAGADFFHLPIGSIITPGAIYAAKRRHNDDKVMAALEREDLELRGAQGMDDRSAARRAANIQEIRRKLAEKEKTDSHNALVARINAQRSKPPFKRGSAEHLADSARWKEKRDIDRMVLENMTAEEKEMFWVTGGFGRKKR